MEDVDSKLFDFINGVRLSLPIVTQQLNVYKYVENLVYDKVYTCVEEQLREELYDKD
jgi:hypothetical protein